MLNISLEPTELEILLLALTAREVIIKFEETQDITYENEILNGTEIVPKYINATKEIKKLRAKLLSYIA